MSLEQTALTDNISELGVGVSAFVSMSALTESEVLFLSFIEFLDKEILDCLVNVGLGFLLITKEAFNEVLSFLLVVSNGFAVAGNLLYSFLYNIYG